MSEVIVQGNATQLEKNPSPDLKIMIELVISSELSEPWRLQEVLATAIIFKHAVVARTVLGKPPATVCAPPRLARALAATNINSTGGCWMPRMASRLV